MLVEDYSGQGLGHDVGDHTLSGDVGQPDVSLFDVGAHKVMVDLDVFEGRATNLRLEHADARLVVSEDQGWAWLLESEFL